MAERAGRGVAPARAALAGNPSDGYGGAVLAVAFGARRAEAVARCSRGLEVRPHNLLVEATVRRFARKFAPEALASTVEWTTSIPRSVGLGGSSALVIATARALCELFDVPLERDRLATFALAVETEDLGIAAGLQDRVAQAYGELTFMEFGQGSRYEPLDGALLPDLVVAWRAETFEESGTVHRGLRARFERGETVVLAALEELAQLARDARQALLAGDRDSFCRCVDGSFDARRRMLALAPGHVEMIGLARGCGASANYAGSGGAVVAVCRDERHSEAVTEALGTVGCAALRLAAGSMGRS